MEVQEYANTPTAKLKRQMDTLEVERNTLQRPKAAHTNVSAAVSAAFRKKFSLLAAGRHVGR